VYGQLVKTRYGFHIVAVDRRAAGSQVPFEAVRGTIAKRLRAQVETRALEQYVRVLAGQANVRGVDLGAVPTPLVQRPPTRRWLRLRKLRYSALCTRASCAPLPAWRSPVKAHSGSRGSWRPAPHCSWRADPSSSRCCPPARRGSDRP